MIRICAAAACCLALPALAAIPEPAGLPPALRAGPGEAASFVLGASGVQIYTCMQSSLQANAYGWVPSAPDATLYDGTRGVARLASPDHWEALDDRSSVSGVLLRMQSAGAGNLPWTRMRALPVGDTGIFAGVTSILRVNTSGGGIPTESCDETHAGNEARQGFTAVYYFYKVAGAA